MSLEVGCVFLGVSGPWHFLGPGQHAFELDAEQPSISVK